MKKTVTTIICALMLLTAAACSEAMPEDNPPADSAIEQPLSGALNSADYVLNVSYTPIYKDVDFTPAQMTSGCGEPQCYTDLHSFLECDDYLNFVGYEIIGQYTPEEAIQITGKDFFEHSTTLYKAHVYYDYLNDKPLDFTVNLAKAGTPELQFENNPPYIIGQELASYINDIDSDWCIAVPEIIYSVYEINDIKFAYHIGSDKIIAEDDSFPNLNMTLFDSERSIITSTSNNPVIYTQKSALSDLVEFLRRDWKSKGYKFQDLENLKPDNPV